jgi:predicted ferric reductase
MAMVKKYRTIVKTIDHLLPDVYTATLASQNGKFRYRPGQFLHLTLEEYDPSKQWPESRCFSIQTNPEEKCIKITFSVKGKYTRRIADELHEAKEVWVKLPYGELFESDYRNEQCIFIAGGTGVTPYLSLFTSKEFTNYKNPVLYFGVRNENYHIYKAEFAKALKINPTICIKTVYAETDGMLNIEKVFSENGTAPVYFLSGPPLMIKTFRKRLIAFGIPDSRVRTDEWE